MADITYGPHASAGTYAPGSDLVSTADQQYQQTGRIPDGMEIGPDGHLQRKAPSFFEQYPWLVPLIVGGAATGGGALAGVGAGGAGPLAGGYGTATTTAAAPAGIAADAGTAATTAAAGGGAASLLSRIAPFAAAALPLAVNHGSNATSGSPLTPAMQAQLEQLLALSTQRVQSTTPIHQAAMAMALRLAPAYARGATTPTAGTPGAGSPTNPSLSPAQVQAILALANRQPSPNSTAPAMAVPRQV